MSGRIRSIKPELLEDAATANLSDTAFRLFVSMFLLADDYGNLRAEPRYIHGQVFWARDPSVNLEAALAELGVKLVRFYVVDGQSYAHITGWGKHQKVAHPGKPRIPGPPQSSRESHENLGEPHETLMPDLRPRPTTTTTTNDQRPVQGVVGLAGFESEAFRAGVSKGLGREVTRPKAFDASCIQDAIAAHCPPAARALGSQGQLDWVRESAERWARLHNDPALSKFTSGFKPARWVAWLNEGAHPPTATHARPGKHVQGVDWEAPWLQPGYGETLGKTGGDQ